MRFLSPTFLLSSRRSGQVGAAMGERNDRDRISRTQATLEGNPAGVDARADAAEAIAAVSGSGLRYALAAPHKTRPRATLRPLPETEHKTEQDKHMQMPNHEKGTFLTR